MTVNYKTIKFTKPAGRRATDIEDTTDSYQDIYTPVFSNIIDGGQEYLLHRFKTSELNH